MGPEWERSREEDWKRKGKMDSGSLTRDNIVARNCSIRSPFPTTNQSLVNCTSTIAVLTYHKACSRSGLLS